LTYQVNIKKVVTKCFLKTTFPRLPIDQSLEVQLPLIKIILKLNALQTCILLTIATKIPQTLWIIKITFSDVICFLYFVSSFVLRFVLFCLSYCNGNDVILGILHAAGGRGKVNYCRQSAAGGKLKNIN